MKICKTFQWDAAHQLVLPYKSKCTNMHGHTYKVEIEIEGDVNDDGMVIDFERIKELVKPVTFDHQTLNEIEWFKKYKKNPTAENLVFFIKERLDAVWKPFYPKLRRIRVWETPNSYAEEVWNDIPVVLQHFIGNSKKLEQLNAELDTVLKQLQPKVLTLKKQLR